MMTKVYFKNKIEMGSALASRAVFRAPAENLGRIQSFSVFRQAPRAKRLDASRVQPHLRRACSPNPREESFRVNSRVSWFPEKFA